MPEFCISSADRHIKCNLTVNRKPNGKKCSTHINWMGSGTGFSVVILIDSEANVLWRRHLRILSVLLSSNIVIYTKISQENLYFDLGNPWRHQWSYLARLAEGVMTFQRKPVFQQRSSVSGSIILVFFTGNTITQGHIKHLSPSCEKSARERIVNIFNGN